MDGKSLRFEEEEAEVASFLARQRATRSGCLSWLPWEGETCVLPKRAVYIVGGCFATALLLLVVIAVLPSGHHHDDDDSDPIGSWPPRDSTVREFSTVVVGDWGRRGQMFDGSANAEDEVGAANQTMVSISMSGVVDAFGAEFVVSTGDNFYEDGLDGASDPLFQQSFTEVYDGEALQVTWHAVLGNHDYHGNSEVQVDGSLTGRDARWHGHRSGLLEGHAWDGESFGGPKLVDFIMIDTCPFITDYRPDSPAPSDTTYNFTAAGGFNMEDWEQQLKSQLDQLEQQLQDSDAPFKVVIGHHPIRSYGSHRDTNELLGNVDYLLWKYGVHLYLNGHDHNLQHIERESCCYIQDYGITGLQYNASAPDASPLIINEVSPSGNDFVELKNTGAPVPLANWMLTDDNHDGHVLTMGLGACANDVVNGYYVLYRKDDPGCLALPTARQACQCFDYGLGSSHDEARLLSPEGVVVDSVGWNQDAPQAEGSVYGRYPDGQSEVKVLTPPTPGESNDAASIDTSSGASEIVNGMPTWSLVSDPPPEYLDTASAPAMHGRTMHYITTGAGSKTSQTLNVGDFFEATSKLFYAGAGFIRLSADDEHMVVTFYDYTGRELPGSKLTIPA